ncbi:hypothetical protein ACFLY3_04690 [Chloroflexota bacterium]
MSEMSDLANTINFENTAYKVFSRLVLDDGPGLLVVRGGWPGKLPKANKTYFLNIVENFQKGMKPGFLPELLAISKMRHSFNRILLFRQQAP